MSIVYETNAFETRGMAEKALDEAKKILNRYGFVSVADLADLCGVEANYLMSKEGWTNLSGAKVERNRNGYVIAIPNPPVDREYAKYAKYVDTDISATRRCYRDYSILHRNTYFRYTTGISNVIFNDPATIVFWADGTKTVVKCQEGDKFSPEVGLAMAISKKALGNQGNYCKVFDKWTHKYYTSQLKDEIHEIGTDDKIKEALEVGCSDGNTDNRPWKIWFERFDENDKTFAGGVWHREYKRKCDATRRAKQLYGDSTKFKWIVSQTNPWGE